LGKCSFCEFKCVKEKSSNGRLSVVDEMAGEGLNAKALSMVACGEGCCEGGMTAKNGDFEDRVGEGDTR
jgi:hypothetical protein